jgi:hypothetical protein
VLESSPTAIVLSPSSAKLLFEPSPPPPSPRMSSLRNSELPGTLFLLFLQMRMYLRTSWSTSVSVRPSPQTIAWLLRASAYVSIHQHTSAYVSIRQHTSAYGAAHSPKRSLGTCVVALGFAPELISIRQQHTSAYISIRQHTSAWHLRGCTWLRP